MAEEFDVFANAQKPTFTAKPNTPHRGRDIPVASGTETPAAKKHFQKPFKKFNRPNGGGMKANNSPLRGANGSESVNPLLNAPLPTEPVQAAVSFANPNRNPELPEYRLADIQTWPSPVIVERMMPGADPEELGQYRKHELIFAAIRAYLAKGGAVLASGCLEIVRE